MAGYSSPIVGTIGGKRQYIFFTAVGALGITTDKGELLWRHPWKTDWDVNAATPILKFFQVADVVEELAVPYLQLAFAGEVFLFVSMAIAAAYSGAGDTRTPMLLNGGIVALNAVIDPMFIFAPGEVTSTSLRDSPRR